MLAIPLYVPLIAALVSFVVGFLWYSPFLFGTRWMKLKGFTMESMKKTQQGMVAWYGASFVLSIFQAFILSYALRLTLFQTYSAAVLMAFWIWAGFIVVTQASHQIFGKDKPNLELLAIDAGYQLAQLSIMAVVIAALS